MKRTISVDSSVVAAEDQVSSDLGGEVAILNFEAGTYFGLDNVGARVWSLIQTPRTVKEVRDILLEEYEVDRDRCEHDLIELLQSLADEGLIRVQDGISA